ncbi:hypothetical protein BKA69DRAFT_1108428 [Paraphysoderma sedebokerense]|nr:hypothetical protein BKA69DRAFT_1108428 [Paraphysoderma sedebokerense]
MNLTYKIRCSSCPYHRGTGLFKELLEKMGGSDSAPNFMAMAIQWNGRANGTSIFYKLKEYLKMHYHHWLQARNEENTMLMNSTVRNDVINRINSTKRATITATSPMHPAPVSLSNTARRHRFSQSITAVPDQSQTLVPPSVALACADNSHHNATIAEPPTLYPATAIFPDPIVNIRCASNPSDAPPTWLANRPTFLPANCAAHPRTPVPIQPTNTVPGISSSFLAGTSANWNYNAAALQSQDRRRKGRTCGVCGSDECRGRGGKKWCSRNFNM